MTAISGWLPDGSEVKDYLTGKVDTDEIEDFNRFCRVNYGAEPVTLWVRPVTSNGEEVV